VTHSSEGDRIFPGDTKMARRMSAFDWEQTELGPSERWPQNLKTSVRIALTSRRPMFVPSPTRRPGCVPLS